jgi:uncharacterized protein
MSHENIDVIRTIYRAFNARRLEQILPLCHEDVEWHQVGPFPESNVYRGRDQLGRLFAMFIDTFEDFRFDIDRLLDSGDHVAVIGTARASGVSGLTLDAGFVHICRLRDGLIEWGYDCAGPERSF